MTNIWFIRSIPFLLYFNVVTTFTILDLHISSVPVPRNRWQPYVDRSSIQQKDPKDFLCTERQRCSIQRWYQSGTMTTVGSISKSTRIMRLHMSGIGIATNYTWKEDAYEIDIMVLVPKMTRAKDISFKATSQSIDLRLKQQRKSLVTIDSNDIGDKHSLPESESLTSLSREPSIVIGDVQEEIILLDGSRKLRGRINIDGTYWVITDPTSMIDIHKKHNNNMTVSIHDMKDCQQITVTIEKIIAKPKDDFDIVDYDWNGIYHTEDTNEIYERTYDKPEPFNVRQYAAELGVDIDNINMTMVDKTMFQSKLNITKSTLQTLHKAGYVSEQEVVQQLDGTEYTINEETGEPERITSIFSEAADISTKPVKSTTPIPFIDTDPSWNKVPPPPPVTTTASDGTTTDTTTTAATTSTENKVIQLKRNFTRAAFAEDSLKIDPTTNPFRQSNTKSGSTATSNENNSSNDPINMLTVVRLKEILKSQGLKTSGTKVELQDRLRNQVNKLLQQPNQGEY